MTAIQVSSLERLMDNLEPIFTDSSKHPDYETMTANFNEVFQSHSLFENTPYRSAENYLLRAFERLGSFELSDFQERLKPLKVAELNALNARTTALFQEKKVPVTALKGKFLVAKKRLLPRCAHGGGAALSTTAIIWSELWTPWNAEILRPALTKTDLVGMLAITAFSALYTFGPCLWHGFWHQSARCRLSKLCRRVNQIHEAIFDEKTHKQKKENRPGHSISAQNRQIAGRVEKQQPIGTPSETQATSSSAMTAAPSLEELGRQLQAQKARADLAEKQVDSLKAELKGKEAAHRDAQENCEKNLTDLKTCQEQIRQKDIENAELRDEAKKARFEIGQMQEFLIPMGFCPRASISGGQS